MTFTRKESQPLKPQLGLAYYWFSIKREFARFIAANNSIAFTEKQKNPIHHLIR